MKQINIFKHVAGVALLGLLCSCNDFLDETPKSTISPENYLTEESQLASYANGLYADILPSHGNWSYGTFGTDQHTDNQAYMNYDNKYIPGQWKTIQSQKADDDPYRFKFIYSCNYFLENVMPRYTAKQISGSDANIRHYIGEMYFLRAYEYFKRYQMFGDFPIVRNTLPDQMDPLVEASKRSPRNEVARFIISDLDSAIVLMESNPDKAKTRINKESALLLKSRVALFEGTWLKYFKIQHSFRMVRDGREKKKITMPITSTRLAISTAKSIISLHWQWRLLRKWPMLLSWLKIRDWYNRLPRNLLTHIWICSRLWICRPIAKCCCGARIVKVSAKYIVSL